MNRWSIINRIGITAALALAVYTGCQTGAPNGVTPPAGDVTTVGAALPDVPMEFSPDQAAERTNYLDVSGELPDQDATDVAFGFEQANLSISVRPDATAKAVSPKTLTISLAIAEGANSTPCTSGVSAGRFILDVAADGGISSITPERPRLGEIVATALRLGEVALCTKVEANFTGSIVIKQAKIDVAFNGGSLQGVDDNQNGNTGDNSNGNTDDNSNGNKDDNANDNSDDNANDNTDDNANDNADDNANDNTDDNANDNADDNANDNTDDNANDNADDNANDNTDDNANDNSDDNANDNTDDNANDNSDDNANDNTDDNANDNTDDNANDNSDDNANDNTDDNANDNSDDNTNTNDNANDNSNTNDNSNDNTSGGLCADGSTRLEGEMDSPVELEAEYRLFPAGCARFRVKVRDYAEGTFDILVNGVSVGTIQTDDDGRGEVRLDTEDGNFPSDFPLMALGDVVQVGSYSVTVGNDCSSDDVDSCNGNGNDNSNDNSNTNG